jgi:hypothetical protein
MAVKLKFSYEVTSKTKKISSSAALFGHPAPKPNVPQPKNDPWGLTQGLSLHVLAADIYLLDYMANFAGIEKVQPKFQTLLSHLEREFSAYTDMAVGGELRHAWTKVQGGHAQIPKPIRDAFKSGLIPFNRHAAWNAWHFIRQRYGTIALKWAMVTFSLPWKSHGYGGPRWANIASCLWDYEVGKHTPLTFVDTAFGLEHNGGCYFSKANTWKMAGLKTVLDLNLKGDYDSLVKFSSKSVSRLFAKYTKEGVI